MDFTLLLDSPREPKRTIQIAKLGDEFEHGKYGKFSIAPDDIESWKRNLEHLPGNRALIDEDHSADRTPRRTEASGWITDVRLENGVPVADIDWTSKGEQAIKDGRYLFISPTFGNFTDEHGTVHENTLIGAALTNRPFLNMPSLCLASDERVSAWLADDPAARFYTRALDGELGDLTRALVMLDVPQAERDKAKANGNALPDGSYPINTREQLHSAAILAASKHGNWQAARKLIRRRARQLGVDVTTLPGFGSGDADSRRTMDKEILTALGLDGDNELLTALEGVELDDAASRKLLDAATGLREQADAQAKEPAPTAKTLEQQAADNGQILLDADTLRTLQLDATAGAAAMQQLHEQRFEHTFEKALKDSRGPRVKPGEKDTLHHFYTLDADATIKLIDEREPLVPATPSGRPAIDLSQADADPEALLAAGVHPGSHDLHTRVKKYMLDNKLPESDYAKVLEQAMNGAVVL